MKTGSFRPGSRQRPRYRTPPPIRMYFRRKQRRNRSKRDRPQSPRPTRQGSGRAQAAILTYSVARSGAQMGLVLTALPQSSTADDGQAQESQQHERDASNGLIWNAQRHVGCQCCHDDNDRHCKHGKLEHVRCDFALHG